MKQQILREQLVGFVDVHRKLILILIILFPLTELRAGGRLRGRG
jgi:hypothetical protein